MEAMCGVGELMSRIDLLDQLESKYDKEKDKIAC
jgi:hypothetical protein